MLEANTGKGTFGHTSYLANNALWVCSVFYKYLHRLWYLKPLWYNLRYRLLWQSLKSLYESQNNNYMIKCVTHIIHIWCFVYYICRIGVLCMYLIHTYFYTCTTYVGYTPYYMNPATPFPRPTHPPLGHIIPVIYSFHITVEFYEEHTQSKYLTTVSDLLPCPWKCDAMKLSWRVWL